MTHRTITLNFIICTNIVTLEACTMYHRPVDAQNLNSPTIREDYDQRTLTKGERPTSLDWKAHHVPASETFAYTCKGIRRIFGVRAPLVYASDLAT